MIDAGLAGALAQTALRATAQTHPHLHAHLVQTEHDQAPPAQLHPAFHTSYDWHSCVHMHWSLARLINLNKLDVTTRDACIARLDLALNERALSTELAYFQQKGRASFERPYGWAWLLKLDAELAFCTEPKAAAWRAALAPLVAYLAEAFVGYLSQLQKPIRHGVHANTAFACVLALQWSRIAAHHALTETITQRAHDWFADDIAHGVFWEPSGTDFLSPTLTQALLMSQLLRADAFRSWFAQYLPVPLTETPLLDALVPSTRTDAQLVHWDGLNLAKAWCAKGIVRVLALDDPHAVALSRSAQTWLDTSSTQAIVGDFVATHWLASFVLLAETEFDGMM